MSQSHLQNRQLWQPAGVGRRRHPQAHRRNETPPGDGCESVARESVESVNLLNTKALSKLAGFYQSWSLAQSQGTPPRSCISASSCSKWVVRALYIVHQFHARTHTGNDGPEASTVLDIPEPVEPLRNVTA